MNLLGRALREALTEAGLISPENVVGKMFVFTADEIHHHRGGGEYTVSAARIQIAGFVTGIGLSDKTLCLFSAHLEIAGAEVLRFRWGGNEEGWRADIMWPSCEPNHGYAAGHFEFFEHPATLAAN